MSRSWQEAKLGDVLIERRETPDPAAILAGEIPIVAKIGFHEGEISLRAGTETNTGMILIRPGDLVVSGINAYKGAIALYDAEAPTPAAATIHYGSYEVRADRAVPRLLWWLLRSNAFRTVLQEHVPGGIKTELKAKRLLPVPIPLPALAEQRRIVGRIEELAGRIAEARGLRARAIEEAVFLEYAMMKAVRESLLSSEPKPMTLGEVTRVTSGGTPSREITTYWGGDIAWVKTGELSDGDVTAAEEYITSEGVKNSSAKVFPPDTILIALYGQGQTRGRTGRLRISAATNQACAAILPNPERIEPGYLQYWLRSLYIDLREDSHGGAQPNWSGTMIKALQVSLPPLPEQRRIVAYLDGLQAKVDALKALQEQTGAELDALLPAILDRAFKGEL